MGAEMLRDLDRRRPERAGRAVDRRSGCPRRRLRRAGSRAPASRRRRRRPPPRSSGSPACARSARSRRGRRTRRARRTSAPGRRPRRRSRTRSRPARPPPRLRRDPRPGFATVAAATRRPAARGPGWAPDVRVRLADGRCPHPDEQLAIARHGPLDLLDVQDLRRPVPILHDSPHQAAPTSSRRRLFTR